jgi:hypothetical protein
MIVLSLNLMFCHTFFILNDASAVLQSIADLGVLALAPVCLHHADV